MFNDQDLKQIEERGSELEAVSSQIHFFVNGFPWMDIRKAATVGDGILKVDQASKDQLVKQYEDSLAAIQAIKFVPASGAASRMFKELFTCKDGFQPSDAPVIKASEDKSGSMGYFFKHLDQFAFHADLAQVAQAHGSSLSEANQDGAYGAILGWLLDDDGLGYGQLPKGLLKFHQYADGSRTPLEEHLCEAAAYCSTDGRAKLHFTVSPEHHEKFSAMLDQVRSKFESHLGVTFDVSFSFQKPATDTIAVDMDNVPFREENGELLFRPGGHGALLDNLNDIDADVIFVKNIDNVVPDHLRDDTIEYKKILAGILLRCQSKVFGYLDQLGDAGAAEAALLSELTAFCQDELCIVAPQDFAGMSDEAKSDYFRRKLDRPIKVCGMVKNEGEPGGGPFWSANPDGTVSLQIVESAQIDLESADKKAIVDAATHFNPVDLICGVKNRKGEKYDLMKFRDPDTGFIAYKSKNGRDLKALEWPGLWNGSMSDWNTLFVEVPISTFNPVKTVFDLLRPAHQGA